MELQPERMSAHFMKYHLRGLPVPVVLHEFTSVAGENAHDHPCDMVSNVLYGDYLERVYTVHPDGSWSSEEIWRRAGHSHLIKAECIHEIIELPTGYCLTAALPGSNTGRTTCFWNFDEPIARFRPWNEANWRPYTAPTT